MKRCLLITFTTALLLSRSEAEPVSEAEGNRLVEAHFRAQKTGVCNIHHIRMQKKLVPIHWGYIEYHSVYSAAEIRDFPNAWEYVNGGRVVDEKKLGQLVPRYVCPECKKAEQRWARRHSNNANAQWILSPTKT